MHGSSVDQGWLDFARRPGSDWFQGCPHVSLTVLGHWMFLTLNEERKPAIHRSVAVQISYWVHVLVTTNGTFLLDYFLNPRSCISRYHFIQNFNLCFFIYVLGVEKVRLHSLPNSRKLGSL